MSENCDHELDSDTVVITDSGPNGIKVRIDCKRCYYKGYGSINDWQWMDVS